MNMKYLILSILIASFTVSSCGDKKPAVRVETPKQEVLKPDTIDDVPEPVIEEVVEEVIPEVRVVVVKEGEWLYSIARNEYGSIQGWRKIYEANKDKIDNPDIIFPNQELIIPE